MGWTRVRCEWFEGHLEFPEVCPNCLGTPVGVPFTLGGDPADPNCVIALPLCDECAALIHRRKRIALLTGVFPCIALVVIGFVVAWLAGPANSGDAWIAVGLIGGAGILVGGHVIAAAIMYLAPRTGGRATNFEPVRVRRSQKRLMADARLLDLEFANEEYARMVIEANPQLNPDLGRERR